ncbi:MAG: ABC transporter ATP-binding protein [Bacilli bacterium]|jgi:ABC-2 type transport system ATP-binding protein|nr:ABC transporter ATP-binding protein [Bacilli bacterium]
MIVEIKGLVKKYKELIAVNNLDLNVKENEILGLLGPNGSGKSTTINCILSLLKYDEGKITIFNQKMSPTAYDIKRKIGLVPQEVSVVEDLNVYENIDYFCGLYIQDKKLKKQYVEEAIEFVGLEDYKKFLPKKLSGGLLRRLNIACGIAHKPELIFFDEPTVAVDPQSRNNILEGIKKLRDNGATIVYTSHYMEEVEQLCDYIIILDKGEIIAQGNVEQLKDMVSEYEKISFEIYNLDNNIIEELKYFRNVNDIKYHDNLLAVKFYKAEHNLQNILTYFKNIQINPNKIISEQPTLNDVFLKLTGKELRD